MWFMLCLFILMLVFDDWKVDAVKRDIAHLKRLLNDKTPPAEKSDCSALVLVIVVLALLSIAQFLDR